MFAVTCYNTPASSMSRLAKDVHINVQCVDFDIAFGLQRSLQQDPSHDGRGAEGHRQGSDVLVQERANHESSSEEEVSCLARPSTRFQREEAAGGAGALFAEHSEQAGK